MTAANTDAIEPVDTVDIPASLRPCFQEYDFSQLDPIQHGDLIIERTLAYGNRREVRWLFDYYGQTRLVDWVQQLGSRRWPWRRYNLWCVLLYLPPARRLHQERSQIWPH